MSIYEVHAGSWQRADDGSFLTWDELADRLIPYVVDMGFTHIEFMPITEHPYDPSWGYQTDRPLRADRALRRPGRALRASSTAPIAPASASSSTGCRRIFRSTSMASRGSTAPRSTSTPIRARASIPDWNTAIYNFGRREVVSFLVNNALYWAEKFHHRRAARRCGRLDALPRLLAQGGRVDPQRERRPREPRGGRASCRR